MGVQVYEVGYLYAINGLMVVVLQFPVARWVSRFRMTNAISIGAFIYATGYFLVAFTSDFFSLAFCWSSSAWERSWSRRHRAT